jgi:hypothetical protein
MVQHHHHSQGLQVLRLVVVTAAGLVAVGLGPGPVAARQDPGPPAVTAGHDGGCSLQRVGTQFVRCDDNTGNGVPAPGWIAER